MTQIIGLVTQDAVFIVSDRRLTFGPGPRFGQLFDDDTCKLVSLCATCAVAYTGLARLGNPPLPTHDWIAVLLAVNNCNRGSIAARILMDAATGAFESLPYAPPHSFVIGGWGRFGSQFGGDVRPYLCVVSNTLGDDGALLETPRPTFVGDVRPLATKAAFDLVVQGRPLRSADRARVLNRMIRRLVEHHTSRSALLKLLVDEVVYTSKADRTVGNKVLATVIPRTAVGIAGGQPILFSDPDEKTPTFSYFEPGYKGLIQFGPTIVCDGWAVTNVEGTIEGDDQSIQVKVLRANPGTPLMLGVRAGPQQGYFYDFDSNRFFKRINGEFIELKKD